MLNRVRSDNNKKWKNKIKQYGFEKCSSLEKISSLEVNIKLALRIVLLMISRSQSFLSVPVWVGFSHQSKTEIIFIFCSSWKSLTKKGTMLQDFYSYVQTYVFSCWMFRSQDRFPQMTFSDILLSGGFLLFCFFPSQTWSQHNSFSLLKNAETKQKHPNCLLQPTNCS